jgi:hypothetical protein
VTLSTPNQDPAAVRSARRIILTGEALQLRVRFRPHTLMPAEDLTAAIQTEATISALESAALKSIRRSFDKSYGVTAEPLGADAVLFRVTAYRRVERTSLLSGHPGGVFEANILAALASLTPEAQRIVSDVASYPVAATSEWEAGPGLTIAREDSRSGGVADLEGRISEIRTRQRLNRRLAIMAGAFGIVFIGAGAVSLYSHWTRLTGFLLGYGGVFVLSGFLFWSMLSDSDYELRDLRDQLDLSELMQEPLERRAQKLFQVHSHQLKRYYDQALRQRGLIFLTGLLCIVAGFGVIAAAFVLLTRAQTSLSEKIVIASLGAVGGILGNFIAVVYLRMFTETVKSIGGFHDRLVVTHHLHFANFLAAKVSSQQERDTTFARMAQALAPLPSEDLNERIPSDPGNGSA